MKTFEEKKKQYAQLLIKFGLNLQKGQNLILNAPIEAHDFVLLLAEVAYEAGAREIFYRRQSERLEALKYEKAPEEVFGSYPQWLADGYTEEVQKNCAVLALRMDDPKVLEKADPRLLEKEVKARASAFKRYKDFVAGNGTNWLIASIPTAGWANAIYGTENTEENVQKLRNQIFSLVRLDSEDPFQAWETHLQNLKSYADFLNSKSFKKLYYRSEKTDLTVVLPEGHRRISAGEKTKSGIPFCPNMPTEEVFSMPHKYGVDGILASTLPLHYQGKLISNFSLTFKAGEVVDFSAEEGYEVLKSLLKADPWSKRLGEVAIVPVSSPISQSGLVFFNTLFDENASCHFALWSAYPTNLLGAETMSAEEKDKVWMNESMMHVDFMVGDKSLTITGETESWEKIPFFVNGEWNILP